MTKVFGIEIGGKKESALVPEQIDHRAEVREFRTTTPSLNIIPPQVINSYAVTSLRNNFIVAAVIIALGLGGVFGYGFYLDGQSNADLEALQTETTQLQTEAANLAPYGQFYTAVGEKRTSLGTMMNGEVDTYAIYNSVYEVATQNGIKLSSVSITIAGQDNDGAVSCPTPDPFGSSAGLGCVSFEGTAGNRSTIDSFVNSLNQVPGFANAYVPSSSATETGSSVSGSVLFNEQFRTERWADYTLPLETILQGDGTQGGEAPEQNDTLESPAITTNPEGETGMSNLFPDDTESDIIDPNAADLNTEDSVPLDETMTTTDDTNNTDGDTSSDAAVTSGN